MRRLLLVFFSLVAVSQPSVLRAAVPDLDASVFLTRPPDASSPTLTGCTGDGVADCSNALQDAVDALQKNSHYGVLYIPEGRYRLTRTIHVWAGIRLVGFGARRPVLLLPAATAGFTDAAATKPVLWFVHERPKDGGPVQEGTSDSFYSALLNVDMEIAAGNGGAIGVRFHVAQHGILQRLAIHMLSGHAALQDVGNVGNDLHLVGGEYGIDTVKTAPGWPFVLMDSVVEGQGRAAIRTREAGMTLVRVRIEHVPVGVTVPEGQIDELYLGDSTFSDVRDMAIQPGEVRNVRSEIAADDVRCLGVKQFLPATAVSAAVPGAGKAYTVERLRLGVLVGPDGRAKSARLEYRDHPQVATAPETNVPVLSAVSSWVDVKTLGVVGDGVHDDTGAIRAAVAAHRVLFFPAGRYRVTGTLRLKADTELIGLHPFTTQLVLADDTPEFTGTGAPIPVVDVPAGAAARLSGIGVSTGVFNPRALGVLWAGGARSMLEDVKFFGGRGTLDAAGKPIQVYPSPSGVDRQRAAGLDTQSPSLVVRGGGVFRAIWSASGFAHAGILIENSSAPGSIYGFSCEHHMRHEVMLHDAAHWRIYGLQTEEEAQEGKDAVAVELDHVDDVAFRNLFLYRVSRSVGPSDHAITLGQGAKATFANVHVFAGGRYAFDNSFFDERSNARSRIRELAGFDAEAPLVVAKPAEETGFGPLRELTAELTDATGLAWLPNGELLLTDAAVHKVFRLDTRSGEMQRVDVPAGIEPVALVFSGKDKGYLLDSQRKTFAWDKALHVDPSPLQASPTQSRVEMVLPVGGHSGLRSLNQIATAMAGLEGNDAVLPQPADPRPLLYGSQFDLVRPSEPFLAVSEEDAIVSHLTLDAATGRLIGTDFGWVAGTAVVRTAQGRTFVAGEQLLELDHGGKVVATVELPSRPTSLLLGGPSRDVLYIGARSSVFALPLLPRR